jgi:ATP-dependent RNA helicase RhlE
VSYDEIKLLKDIDRIIKKLIPRTLIDGFEPVHDVPTSQLDTRPIKPKKPKKVRKPGDKTVTQAGKPSKTQKNIRKPLATNKKRKYKSKAKKPGLDPYANYRSKNKKR